MSVNTKSVNIEGISVKLVLHNVIVDDKRAYNSNDYYFFQKDGNYYRVWFHSFPDSSMFQDKIDDAIKSIIKTI